MISRAAGVNYLGYHRYFPGGSSRARSYCPKLAFILLEMYGVWGGLLILQVIMLAILVLVRLVG